MSRRDHHPFMSTSRRRPAYHTHDCRFWIVRSGSKWTIFRMDPSTTGETSDRVILGVFPTLTAAVTFHRRDAAP